MKERVSNKIKTSEQAQFLNVLHKNFEKPFYLLIDAEAVVIYTCKMHKFSISVNKNEREFGNRVN